MLHAKLIAYVISLAMGHPVYEPPPKSAIVHRDVKPDNMDDDRDCAEILDDDDGEDCED
jgi:hypothetical protein